jgi:ectoine hydroxylase-related dioxygenase (phytanoyl-CoA dioxygenase family)
MALAPLLAFSQHAAIQPNLTRSADGSGGILGPVDLSSALGSHSEACMIDWERLRGNWRQLGLRERPPEKSAHILVPSCRAMALHPSLLRVVGRLVGAPMILATMSFLVKPAGYEHRWHSDIENYVDPERCPGGSSWTVWLPLRHSSARSTLHLVSHTHDVNRSAHDVIGRQCKICKRDPSRTLEERGAALLDLSRSLAPSGASSQYIRLAAHDGGAWLFKGRTWHAAANPTNQSRLAVQMHFMPAACRFVEQSPNGNKVYTRRPLGVVPLPTPDPSAGNLCFAPARHLRSVIEAAAARQSEADAAADTAAAASAPHSATASSLFPASTPSSAHAPSPNPHPPVDVCVVVASASQTRDRAPPPPAATELMLRSLRAATSAPVRLHLLTAPSNEVRGGVDAVLQASADAWEEAELVSVTDQTLDAAAEAAGLRGGARGAWGVAPLLLHRLLTVER